VSVQAQLVLHRFDRFVDPAAKRLVLTVRSSQRAEVERESVDVYRHALLQASLTRENHKNAGKKENRAGTFGFLVTLNKHERCEPSRRRIQGLSCCGASEIAPIPSVLSGLNFANGVELFREKPSHLYADYVN